ncbi:MAG: F0F1 ATP synthase subunit gamma, partial [Candidatus Limnocylindrus sp.]
GLSTTPDFSPVPEGSVDAIIITHAHQDHSGSLPFLTRREPQCPVFLTEPTAHITEIMLHNSVNVMTRQRDELNLPEYPLYTHRGVDFCEQQWVRCAMRKRFNLAGEPSEDENEVTFEFYHAGHILGSAGALNSNLIRFALKELESAGPGTRIVTIGKKGRDALARGGYEIAAAFPGYGDKPTFADVTPLVRLVTDDFLGGRATSVTLIHPTFVSTLVQRPEGVQLLPIQPTADTAGIPGNQFLFEPDPATVLEALLPRYVATRIFQAVLETTACEQSSRMVAMKNATESAGDLISDLTLTYNKVRQANITREMIEIASGASAH